MLKNVDNYRQCMASMLEQAIMIGGGSNTKKNPVISYKESRNVDYTTITLLWTITV